MTLEEFCRQIPPRRLRLLARTGHGKGCRLMSWTEIATRSGRARSTVVKILSQADWGDTGVQTIDALMRGCGVNLWRTESHRKLIRRGDLVHIQNANASQRRMVARMLKPARLDSSAGHQIPGPGAGSNPA